MRRTGASAPLAVVLVALAGFVPAGLDARPIEKRVRIEAPPPPPPSVQGETGPVAGTIEQAVALAYEANPRLLAEQSTVRGADARYAQARAAYGPTLTARGTYGYAYDRFDTPLGVATKREGFSATATAILNQPLFTSGRLQSGVRVAEAGIAASRQSLRLIESQVLYGVYSSYIGVLRDRALVRIAEENYDLLTRQFGQSEERVRVREITVADLEQIRTRLATGAATRETQRNALSNSRAQFLRYVGALPAEVLMPLPVAPAAMPGSLDDAYVVAEQDSPLLLAAHARERISRAQVQGAESSLGPTVSLQGSASYGALEPYNNDLNQTNLRAGVVAEWPVFTSGLRLARIREAQAANQADWRLVDDALRETRVNIEQNWDRMVSSQRAAAQYRVAAEAAKNAYDGAVLQERAGARTTFEVLDLLRDLLDVRSALVRSEADAELARYALLAAMGKLEAPIQVDSITAYSPADKLRRTKSIGDTPPITQIVETVDALPGAALKPPPRSRAYRDPAAPLRAPGLPPEAPAAGPTDLDESAPSTTPTTSAP